VLSRTEKGEVEGEVPRVRRQMEDVVTSASHDLALAWHPVLTSPPDKVCVFSEVFRYRKTKVAYINSQFLSYYRLKPYTL
jgi:hypothetical protein